MTDAELIQRAREADAARDAAIDDGTGACEEEAYVKALREAAPA